CATYYSNSWYFDVW
nr:immunoglobulin heavy chain junction region [Mus musculus]